MNPAAADTAFAAFLCTLGLLAADVYWEHLRGMDRRTGRRRKERDDQAMLGDLQRRGENWPRWRP